MKTRPSRGSHLPVLLKLLTITSGPVAEFGSGWYSTPVLHWACYERKRRLVTFESNETYRGFAEQFRSDYHEIRFVTDWDAEDLSAPWSIAFVDHAPDERRVHEIRRLTHAEYVVAHDAENRREEKYRYSSIHGLFKYRWKYGAASPATAVYSNFHDLRRFTVG